MVDLLIWDFVDHRNENVILKWVLADRLDKRDRAQLNQKIRRLAQVDFNLAINTKLLAGPIYEHIYKLHAKGCVQLRPMLCRGPMDNDAEYTLLLGAVEIGGQLPLGSREKAAERREAVINDSARRRIHQRIP